MEIGPYVVLAAFLLGGAYYLWNQNWIVAAGCFAVAAALVAEIFYSAKGVVTVLMLLATAIGLFAIARYRLENQRRFKTLLEVLGGERDPLSAVDAAKVLVAYGRIEKAISVLQITLVQYPERSDIAKAVEMLQGRR